MQFQFQVFLILILKSDHKGRNQDEADLCIEKNETIYTIRDGAGQNTFQILYERKRLRPVI